MNTTMDIEWTDKLSAWGSIIAALGSVLIGVGTLIFSCCVHNYTTKEERRALQLHQREERRVLLLDRRDNIKKEIQLALESIDSEKVSNLFNIHPYKISPMVKNEKGEYVSLDDTKWSITWSDQPSDSVTVELARRTLKEFLESLRYIAGIMDKFKLVQNVEELEPENVEEWLKLEGRDDGEQKIVRLDSIWSGPYDPISTDIRTIVDPFKRFYNVDVGDVRYKKRKYVQKVVGNQDDWKKIVKLLGRFDSKITLESFPWRPPRETKEIITKRKELYKNAGIAITVMLALVADPKERKLTMPTGDVDENVWKAAFNETLKNGLDDSNKNICTRVQKEISTFLTNLCNACNYFQRIKRTCTPDSVPWNQVWAGDGLDSNPKAYQLHFALWIFDSFYDYIGDGVSEERQRFARDKVASGNNWSNIVNTMENFSADFDVEYFEAEGKKYPS